MIVQRSFLVQITQTWQGEPGWEGPTGRALTPEQDQHVSDHWQLVGIETQSVDGDPLVSMVVPHD